MKKLTKVTLVPVLALALGMGGSLAMAHGKHDGPRLERHAMQPLNAEQHQARMQEQLKLKLARLELALALKPEQQSAWLQFQQDAQQRLQARTERMKSLAGAARPKTTLERLEWREKMGEQRQAELAATRKAVAAFYQTLSPAQQTVFDAEFMRQDRSALRGDRRDGRGDVRPAPDKRAPSPGVTPENAR